LLNASVYIAYFETEDNLISLITLPYQSTICPFLYTLDI
jgi:hypothetical protein